MLFKSSCQPLCRYCGTGIKKRTETVYFAQSRERSDDYSTFRTERPTSKADAQRMVNAQIVSVSWSFEWIGEWPDQTKRREHIARVTTWDGESWEDEFFCNADHARQFGYACARVDMSMPAYKEAKAARGG